MSCDINRQPALGKLVEIGLAGCVLSVLAEPGTCIMRSSTLEELINHIANHNPFFTLLLPQHVRQPSPRKCDGDARTLLSMTFCILASAFTILTKS